MNPRLLAKLERLANKGIDMLPAPEGAAHLLLSRDGFVALVQHTGDDLGSVGSTGKATERGFAALVWRGGQAYFIEKGLEQAATEGEIALLRRFADDLATALA